MKKINKKGKVHKIDFNKLRPKNKDSVSSVPETVGKEFALSKPTNFENITFYDKHKVAVDNNRNYLGQWEWEVVNKTIRITKSPGVFLEEFDTTTGHCKLGECKPMHEKDIVMLVDVKNVTV